MNLKLCEVGESSKMKLHGGRKSFGANLYETEVPQTCWLTVTFIIQTVIENICAEESYLIHV